MVRTLHDHVRASKSAAGIVTAKCCSLFLSPAGPRRRTASLWQPSDGIGRREQPLGCSGVFVAGPRKHSGLVAPHGGMIYPLRFGQTSARRAWHTLSATPGSRLDLPREIPPPLGELGLAEDVEAAAPVKQIARFRFLTRGAGGMVWVLTPPRARRQGGCTR